MIPLSRNFSITWLLLAGACGGGGGGGTLSGTVHGQSFMIEDATSAVVTIAVGGINTDIHAAQIVMANAKNLCADAMSNASHHNEKGVSILLTDFNGSTSNPPTASGTYSVYQGSGTPAAKAAFVEVDVIDAMCKPVTAQDAFGASGTVTLTSVSGNRFSGNFDLVLDSGDHVIGSFDPKECPARNLSFPLNVFEFCI